MIGPAMKELDAAEAAFAFAEVVSHFPSKLVKELVTKPRAGQPQRSGAYERSLLVWFDCGIRALLGLLLRSV